MHDQRGQAMIFIVVGIVVIVAMAAVVVDVGAWFRGQRHLQTVADAAALAGAQDLPNTGQALTTALDYAQQNWNGVNPPSVTFPSQNEIKVHATQPVDGIFSKIISSTFASIDVHAKAVARIGVPASLRNIAPISVKNTQEMLTGAGCGQSSPCFGSSNSTTLNFNESVLSSSSFGLIDLECPGGGCGGGAGTAKIIQWIDNGYQGYVDVNKDYPALTGQRIGPVRDALNRAVGRTLLFPVFDSANDSAKTFHIISWAAFVISETVEPNEWKNDVPGCRPDCKVLTGYFTEVLVQGFLSGSGSPPYFGVKVVNLVG